MSALVYIQTGFIPSQALPEDLKQTHKFLLLWQQGISYRGHWIRYPWSTLGIKHQGLAQTARKSCLIVKFQATNDPLSLRLDEQRHRCTNATFEIARNALPVITKMVPAALPETAPKRAFRDQTWRRNDKLENLAKN